MPFHSRPLKGPLGGSSPSKRGPSHPKHDADNLAQAIRALLRSPHGQVPSKSQEKRKLDRWRWCSLGYGSDADRTTVCRAVLRVGSILKRREAAEDCGQAARLAYVIVDSA